MDKKGRILTIGLLLMLSLIFTLSILYIQQVSAPTTRLQELISLSSSATDTGIYTNQGIKLDWLEKGPLHRCLQINISRSITSPNLSFLLKEADFNTNTEVKNIKFEKYSNQSYQEDIYSIVCNPYQITNPNSSITTIPNCSRVLTGTETKYRDLWNELSIITSESQTDARLDTFNHLGTGKYRYCFNIPLKQNGNGYGNKGTVYLEADNTLYVDRQGSSWWNESYIYKSCLNIANQDNETMLSNFTVNFSLDTNALYSAGKLKADCSDLRIIYNNITELDRVTANNTFIESGVSCLKTNETIFFHTVSNISAFSSDTTNYCMYYGNLNAGSAAANHSRVWLIYEDCDRPNSVTVGNGWISFGTSPGPNITNKECYAATDNNAMKKSFASENIYLPEWNLRVRFGAGNAVNRGNDMVQVTEQGDSIAETIAANSYGLRALWSDPNGLKVFQSVTVVKHATASYVATTRYSFRLLHEDDKFFAFNNTRQILWDTTNITDDTKKNFNSIGIFWNVQNDTMDNLLFERALSNMPIVKIGPEQQVINFPPNITQITLTPLSPVTTDDLNCTIQVLDNEQTSLFVNIAWYNNSILKFNFTNQPITNGTLTSFILNNANTTKNENWSCSAVAFDGTLWGGTNHSQGITIQNSPPTQSQPLLTATSILNSTTDNLTCYNRSTADVNKDPVTNIYNWYKNSQPLLALNMPFETSAKDYSGRNNDGTITGPAFIQGKVGKALSFDGIDDYVDVNSATLNQDFNAITIEAWVYANSIPSTGEGLLSKTNLNYGLTYYTDGNVWAYINGGGNSIHTPLTTQTWHHLVETFDGIYIKLYVDGIEKASKLSIYPTTGTGGTFRIGRSYSGGFNGTIDEIKVYPYSLSEKQIKQRYDETKDGLTTNSTITAEETIPGDAYFCQITPNDGIIDGLTTNSTEIKILWNITFNVTSGEDGSPLQNFNINCNNSFTKTGANSPYTTGFLPGSYECKFTKIDFFNETITFTADSDRIINVKMSRSGFLSTEEHNQLQAIYDCLISGNCEAYNLWKNINKTVFEIWKHELRTDRAVVTNEAFNSRTLNSTLNISINYTINIPFKTGYAQGELLPLRMFFWFHNYNAGDNNSIKCYSQDKSTTTLNRAESPFCLPLVAEILGPNNGTVTFTVDLRPNLTSGTYNITRSIEIDPLFNNKPVWINYGQEVIGTIAVLESTQDQPSININQKSLKYPEIKSYLGSLGSITSGAIRDILTNGLSGSITFLIALIIISTAFTVVFVSYFRNKYK